MTEDKLRAAMERQALVADPKRLAAVVAAKCAPLNDTERERARRLALEHQMATVAESYDRAQKIWGKPLRRAGRRGPTKIDIAADALRREPCLSNADMARKLGLTNKTVWRARKRIENECLTNRESFSEYEAQSENV